MPSERGILMSGPMVRAILEGRKTQTRRIMDPQPALGSLHTKGDTEERLHWIIDRGDSPQAQKRSSVWEVGEPPFWTWSPYAVGDRLYVRETWRRAPADLPDGIQYRADKLLSWFDNSDRAKRDAPLAAALPRDGRWRPSIHMPKWAARLWLTVTEVRVERVQDTTAGDAVEEGAPLDCRESSLNALGWFYHQWQSLYPGSWERNDWVWVYTFEVDR